MTNLVVRQKHSVRVNDQIQRQRLVDFTPIARIAEMKPRRTNNPAKNISPMTISLKKPVFALLTT